MRSYSPRTLRFSGSEVNEIQPSPILRDRSIGAKAADGEVFVAAGAARGGITKQLHEAVLRLARVAAKNRNLPGLAD